jgi:hypothetical protein
MMLAFHPGGQECHPECPHVVGYAAVGLAKALAIPTLLLSLLTQSHSNAMKYGCIKTGNTLKITVSSKYHHMKLRLRNSFHSSSTPFQNGVKLSTQ